MRLLFLTHNILGRGGSYQRAASLARALAERGHVCTLIGGRPAVGLAPLRESRFGITEIAAPDVMPRRVRHGGLSPLDIAWRSAFVTSMNLDLVHSFDHRPSVLIPAWLLSRLRGVTWISDWADLWGRGGIADTRPLTARGTLGVWDHWAESLSRRRADAVTVVNHYLNERILDLGIDPLRVQILPPGANRNALELTAKIDARRRLRLPEEAPVVAHSGFSPYDAGLLLDTLELLLTRSTSLHVLTTGRTLEGLYSRLVGAGVADRWLDLGAIPYHEIGVVLSAADVLLLPYSDKSVNRGRFPNKLGDYMAAGRPVVTNPTGDVAGLVEGHGIGLEVEATPEAMAEATLKLLSEPEIAKAMGLRAKALAESQWAWSARAVEAETFYRTVLAAS